MQDNHRRFPRFVVFLAAFAVIFYGAYSGHTEFMRQFAVAEARTACQQHSEARGYRQSDCSPENAVIFEPAVFDRRMAEAHDPVKVALIAIGCFLVISVANLLIG
jgi:hypothetical protein